MLPLVEIPELVRHYAPGFASVFSPDAFAQFQRYVSGLILSENKTVDGINRIFVIDGRHQSRLNRLLTDSPCSVEAFNQARLRCLSSRAGTHLKPKGMLRVADPLFTHDGQHCDKIAYLYEHPQGCDVWAHNLVHRHDRDDHTDDPVDVRFWEPVEVDALEAGLTAAGVPIRHSQSALQDHAPQKWRHDLLHLWRRHQHTPGVPQISQRTLR
jgi:hypothetical protein